MPVLALLAGGSPVSDDGRGLKLDQAHHLVGVVEGSPVSDDGRGLKPDAGRHAAALVRARPSVMTGAD